MGKKYRLTVVAIMIFSLLGSFLFYEYYLLSTFLNAISLIATGLNIGLAWLDRHPYNTTQEWLKLEGTIKDLKDVKIWMDSEIAKIKIKNEQIYRIHLSFDRFVQEIVRICANPECSYDSNLQRELTHEAMVKVAREIQAIFAEEQI